MMGWVKWDTVVGDTTLVFVVMVTIGCLVHKGHDDYGDGELWRIDEDGGHGSTLKVIREGDENGSGNGNGGNRYGTTDDGKSTRASDLHGRRSRLGGGGGGGDGLDGDGGRDGLLGNSSGPTNGARIWSGRKHVSFVM